MKYNRLPLEFNGVTCKFKDTSSPYSKSNYHKGVDFGWHKYEGESVYAVNDGTVLDVGKSTGSGNAGNYIWIRHSFDNTSELISRYCHLKTDSIKVKKGDKVSRGQQIASMGNTFGYATHLHELWKVPKNYKFNWNDRLKYIVNPLDYTFADEKQTIGSSSLSKEIMKLLGASKVAKKDTSKNQIEVVGYKLRVRKSAGINQAILGYCDFGIYNYTETKTANGYTWYNVGFGWIAGTKEDTKVYPKKEEVVVQPTNNEETLKKEIETLKSSIAEKDKEILQLKNEIEDLNSKTEDNKYLVFEAKENDKYYIKLNKNEKIYKRV